MNKSQVQEELETAVRETHAKYDVFQGVIVFGSFPTSEHPNDLDLLPVMREYGGNIDFSPVSEDDPEDDQPDYQLWKEIELYFASYFSTQGHKVIIKKYRERDGLIHLESLVSLDNPIQLKREVERYKADPNNFIGTEEARTKLKNIF